MSDHQLKDTRPYHHAFMGRISNGHTGVASFCSCGRAFFGCSVVDADARWAEHKREYTPRASDADYDEEWQRMCARRAPREGG